MAICPKCSSEVTSDFGFSPCPNCGQMLSFDFEGNIKPDTEQESAPIETPSNELELSEENESEWPQGSESQAAWEVQEDMGWEQNEEVQVSSPPTMSIESTTEEVEGQETRVLPPIEDLEFSDYESQERKTYQKEDLQEISDFANSEESNINQGKLFYKVMISGIDSSDIRLNVEESLRDRRLRVDVQELMSNIRDGVLVISKVNPVKASLIVNRLKTLPVQIKWEQYDITEV